MNADKIQLSRHAADRNGSEKQASFVESSSIIQDAAMTMLARQPDFMTVEQVAAVLQMSNNTIRSLLNQHVIPGKKLSHKWVIPRDALYKALIEG